MDDTQVFNSGLEVERHLSNDAAMVRICGTLTFPDAVGATEVMKHVIEQHPPVVLLDLTDLTTVDATGLAVLVGMGGDLKNAGIQVRVVASDPRLRHRLPYTLGLRNVFPTVEEALTYQT